jgi:ketosteroid isomerase-like protein
VDKDREKDKRSSGPVDSPVRNSDMDELYRRLQPEMRRPKPSADAIAAALEAAQRLAAEADAEQAADDTADQTEKDLSSEPTIVCAICGYRNRQGNKFCGMCGIVVTEQEAQSETSTASGRQPSAALTLPSDAFLAHDPAMKPPATRPTGQETHHYHHHYHHHYFPGGEALAARSALDSAREPARESMRDPLRDSQREEKFRPIAALRGDMSRAEAAVRRIAHEWVLACNTKHLDDLLELYTADALVLRSNCPPLRGASAVHEFFFGALDAGLGEVELEPLRVEVVGELAYEGGRFKALIPSATGKRREERGKYLWVCARQTNGEWKVSADCWSSDLTLSTLESDIPQGAAVKTSQPRKNP